jgi:hypothetical protein
MTELEEAEKFARDAFGGLRNPKDGELAILHTERVVANLLPYDLDNNVIVVAWLHDVVEDTSTTLRAIRLAFGPAIARAVDAITHRPGEPREDYWVRIGHNRWSLEVKLLGDVVDNTDPDRRDRLDAATRIRLDSKYLALYRALLPYTRWYDGWGSNG